MKKGKKLLLSEIEVQSFETSLEKDDQRAINGGFEEDLPGKTSNPIFCIGGPEVVPMERTSNPIFC
jgi:hypothetical protein